MTKIVTIVVTGEVADVAFVFPNRKEILTQKDHLARASEVFRAQFASPLNAEGDEKDRIAIADIDFITFKLMVNHIYGEDVEISTDNFINVLYASRKYLMSSLTNKVITFAMKNIYHSIQFYTVCYESLEKLDITILNEYFLYVFGRDPKKLIEYLEKSESNLRLLKFVLKTPRLSCSEFELLELIFNMFKRWYGGQGCYTDECFKRDLGELKYLIRFPAMRVDELLEIASNQPALLTSQEVVAFQLWSEKRIYSEALQNYSFLDRQLME